MLYVLFPFQKIKNKSRGKDFHFVTSPPVWTSIFLIESETPHLHLLSYPIIVGRLSKLTNVIMYISALMAPCHFESYVANPPHLSILRLRGGEDGSLVLVSTYALVSI